MGSSVYDIMSHQQDMRDDITKLVTSASASGLAYVRPCSPEHPRTAYTGGAPQCKPCISVITATGQGLIAKAQNVLSHC